MARPPTHRVRSERWSSMVTTATRSGPRASLNPRMKVASPEPLSPAIATMTGRGHRPQRCARPIRILLWMRHLLSRTALQGVAQPSRFSPQHTTGTRNCARVSRATVPAGPEGSGGVRRRATGSQVVTRIGQVEALVGQWEVRKDRVRQRHRKRGPVEERGIDDFHPPQDPVWAHLDPVGNRPVPGTLLASRSPLGPNWVDPALVLPGLIRGLLGRPTAVTAPLLVHLARTLADAATPLRPSRLLPNPFDRALPALLADQVGNPHVPGTAGPAGYPLETPTWPAIETAREVPKT